MNTRMTFDSQAQGDHVFVKKLECSDTLKTILSYCELTKYTKAVLLLNNKESLCLSDEHLEGFERSDLPVAVIKQSDGEVLENVLKQNKCKCTINIESTVDTHDNVPQWPQGRKDESKGKFYVPK